MGDTYLGYLLLAAPIAAASVAAVGGMRRIALRRSLLDAPNARSSHVVPVPRLGGAAFIPVVLLVLAAQHFLGNFRGPLATSVIVGAGGLFVLSLLDDLKPLPALVRLGAQFLLAGLVMSKVSFGAKDFPHMVLTVAGCVWMVGLLNIYNFMDGIDGIAGVQAVVAGLVWWAVGRATGGVELAILGATVLGAAGGFLVHNWSPAKIFMGDAGSTVLGFLFATAPLFLPTENDGISNRVRSMLTAALAVWPFLADGSFTILRRLRQRENIFEPHRSHLYQRLVITGKSHQTVTLIYGTLALVGALLGWLVIRGYPRAIPLSALVILVLFGLLWGWTIASEKRAL